MKRVLMLFVIILFGISLIGCNSEKEKEGNVNFETQAKQSYIDIFLKVENPEVTIEDIKFRPFLGIYCDSLVAIFYGGKYHGEFPDVEIEYELEGLRFAFSMGYPILVWNKGYIYELPQAYEQGLLTKENIVEIHELYYRG